MKILIVDSEKETQYGPFDESQIYMRKYGKTKRYSIRNGVNLELICEGGDELSVKELTQ